MRCFSHVHISRGTHDINISKNIYSEKADETRKFLIFKRNLTFTKKCIRAHNTGLCRFVMRAAVLSLLSVECNYFLNYYTLLNTRVSATGIKTQDVEAFTITQLSLILHVCRKDQHYATHFRTIWFHARNYWITFMIVFFIIKYF